MLLTPLVTACGGAGEITPAREETPATSAGATVQTADLTGLYEERGDGEDRSRMCIVADGSGAASFGLVVETPAGSCSGAGNAARTGNLLRLTMTGDEQCTIDAAVDGTSVTFPATVAEGCGYYCAPGASLAGISFEKIGGTAQDAARAADLAGDPLCG